MQEIERTSKGLEEDTAPFRTSLEDFRLLSGDYWGELRGFSAGAKAVPIYAGPAAALGDVPGPHEGTVP
jgi:hypothetical protein